MPTAPPIELSVRIRPLRIGYRVNPLDGADIARAIETATSQWGGVFHSLIPTLRRRPKWWNSTPFRSMGPVAIEHFYMEAFDCDFVVDARPGGEEAGQGFDELSFQKLRRDSGEEGIEGGMPAAAVYRQLWTEEFRWEGRGRPDVAIPEAEDSSLGPFIAACFGRFAENGHLSTFRSAYEQLLGGSPLPVSKDNFLEGLPLVAETPFLTPLDIGLHGLEYRQTDHARYRAEVVLVDETQPSDLFDVWNLRATGRPVIPIPLRWAIDLLPELARRLADQPESRNGWDDDVLVSGCRRVPTEKVSEAREILTESGLQVLKSGPPNPSFDLGPVWLSAGERNVDLKPGRLGMTMSLGQPAVSEHYRRGIYRWMNVLNYVSWTLPSDGSIGALLPSELGEVSGLLQIGSHITARAADEGILIPAGSPRDTLEFTPPSGDKVLSHLLTGYPKAATSTEPGRAAAQLIKQMNGLYGVALVQRRPLVKLFNKAAHGAAPAEAAEARSPRPPSRALPLKTLEEAVREIHPNSRRGRSNLMRGLVERDVLRAGLRLNCSHCNYANWIQIDDINRTIPCERCLEEFSFPQQEPPDRHAWAYRPTGAFSIPDFANGGYAVAFALRFLTEDRVRGSASWSSGLQLDPSNDVDFAVVTSDEDELTPRTSLILGEAKSFGSFKQRDFDRAASLASRYPSAFLAFATLRDVLEEEEKRLLKLLARPEVGSVKDLPFEPRVVVLTATELFNREGAPQCWATSGGMGQGLAESKSGFRTEIPTWADVTLQLHVGLSPHRRWVNEEVERLSSA